MLSINQQKAVRFLFEMSAEEAADKLKIKSSTLDIWFADPEFLKALQSRANEINQEATRILIKARLDASLQVHALINSDDTKDKYKAIMDILKASGMLKGDIVQTHDPITALFDSITPEDYGSD